MTTANTLKIESGKEVKEVLKGMVALIGSSKIRMPDNTASSIPFFDILLLNLFNIKSVRKKRKTHPASSDNGNPVSPKRVI